ncbi:MAG: hypothetical protein II041_01500, partial [Bacteroidales bacterium]|nr:hypothetical protein [Bacteroidales bacterium]
SEDMLAKAQAECQELKAKAEGDIKTAARQAMSQVKQDIEKAVTMETVNKPVGEALSSKEFMQDLIKTVVSAFKPENEATSLDMILPESKKEELDGFLRASFGKTLGAGLNVSFSKDISNGFKISRKGSGYFIDLTEDSFNGIIAEYLRPKTRKLIFGE